MNIEEIQNIFRSRISYPNSNQRADYKIPPLQSTPNTIRPRWGRYPNLSLTTGFTRGY
ncbi:MAG: hypothetical protein Q8909_09255 [Bacteroidota bacterium]|nr:hypothetical protein [Bacteroidota bacterium]